MKWNRTLIGTLLVVLIPLSSAADKTNESLCKGKEALEKGDTKEAIKLLTEVIRKDPKNAYAYCYRGKAYYHMSEIDEAYADLSKAIELRKDFAEALAWRGRAGFVLQKWNVALEDLTKSLELNPKNAGALSNRAIIHYERAEYAETIADFKKATELEPEWSEPWCWLAYVLAICPEAKRRNGASAIKYAEKACKLTKWDDYQSMEALAASYAESGKFEDAVKWQKKAVENMKAKGFKDIGERAAGRLKAYEMKKPVRIKSFALDW